MWLFGCRHAPVPTTMLSLIHISFDHVGLEHLLGFETVWNKIVELIKIVDADFATDCSPQGRIKKLPNICKIIVSLTDLKKLF